MDQVPAADGANSTVRFGTQTWELAVGSSLTFGRSDDCDIVITPRVPDLLVSRRAGRLTAVDGGLLVSNESRGNSIYLQGIPGPELEIKPLMTLGTMPFSRCRVVVLGTDPARYFLEIACGSADGSPAGKPRVADTARAGAPTTLGYRRLDMPDSQRRYLAALCEPILTGVAMRTAPATYKEIAKRCGVSPRTVRNSLDALRQMLSEQYKIPGLVHSGDSGEEAPGKVNFLSALAAWAVHSGNANLHDVQALDR